jgi:hypothetical protein
LVFSQLINPDELDLKDSGFSAPDLLALKDNGF